MSEVEERLDVIFVLVESSERSDVPGAGIASGHEIFSGSPAEFRPAEFHRDDIDNHACVATVPVRKRGEFLKRYQSIA